MNLVGENGLQLTDSREITHIAKDAVISSQWLDFIQFGGHNGLFDESRIGRKSN